MHFWSRTLYSFKSSNPNLKLLYWRTPVDNIPAFYSYMDIYLLINICHEGHTQLRFSKLNFDLHKFHIILLPACSCSNQTKDVKHVFLFCPFYSSLFENIMPIISHGVHSNFIINIASDRLVEILLSGSDWWVSYLVI